MIVLLKSIVRSGADSYQVELEDEDRTTRVFTLAVEEGAIQCVTAPDDLAEYMRRNLAPAAPLFAAVLAFHQAQHLEIPEH